MTNPLTDWIPITDRFGTRISQLQWHRPDGLLASASVTNVFIDMFSMTYMIVMDYAVLLLGLVSGHKLFVDVVGEMYQQVLNWAYGIVSPFILALFAFMVLFARIFLIDRELMPTAGGKKVLKFQLQSTFFDEWNKKESHGKRAITQLTNAFVLLMMIVVLMTNPFLLLSMVFGLINMLAGLITSVSTNSDASSTSVAVVDGVLTPLLQLIQFGSLLDSSCTQSWSQTLAAGGNVTELSCLSSSQQQWASDPGMAGVAIAVVATLLAACVGYFGWIVVKKASWYFVLVCWFIFKLPWQMAALIALPGGGRKQLDSLKETFSDEFKTVGWLLGIIAIGNLGPSLLMMLGGIAANQGLPVIVALMGEAVAFVFAGTLIEEYYGKRISIKRDNGRWTVTTSEMTYQNPHMYRGWGDWADRSPLAARIKDTSMPWSWPWNKPSADAALGDDAHLRVPDDTISDEPGTRQGQPVRLDKETVVKVDSATATLDSHVGVSRPPLLVVVSTDNRATHTSLALLPAAHTSDAVPAPRSAQPVVIDGQIVATAAPSTRHDPHSLPAADRAGALMSAAAPIALGPGTPTPGDSPTTSVTPTSGAPGADTSPPSFLDWQSVPTSSVDADDFAAQWRAAVRAFNGADDDYASVDSASALHDATHTGIWADEVASAALSAHQAWLAGAVDVDDDEQLRQAATGGRLPDVIHRTNAMLSDERLDVQWTQTEMLARILGVNIEEIPGGTHGPKGTINVQYSDDDGNNVLIFGQRKGFGDAI